MSSALDFSLPATDGNTFTLSNMTRNFLVLFFYPKDNTPGCSLEAQQFRDLYPKFEQLDCQIAGISRDSIKSHENFKCKFNLPYPLLSDQNEAACGQFGVIKLKNMYGKQVRGIERSTFLIAKDGVILKEWRGVKADGHAQTVLDFVASVNS